jgi:hypothetical protein
MDVLVSEHPGAGVLDEPAELARGQGVRVLAAMATGSVSVSGHSAAAYRASTCAGGCHECRPLGPRDP